MLYLPSLPSRDPARVEGWRRLFAQPARIARAPVDIR